MIQLKLKKATSQFQNLIKYCVNKASFSFDGREKRKKHRIQDTNLDYYFFELALCTGSHFLEILFPVNLL